MRRTVLPCRCHRGVETFEARCPACGRHVVLARHGSGGLSVVADQHGAMATLRAHAREQIARAYDED